MKAHVVHLEKLGPDEVRVTLDVPTKEGTRETHCLTLTLDRALRSAELDREFSDFSMRFPRLVSPLVSAVAKWLDEGGPPPTRL